MLRKFTSQSQLQRKYGCRHVRNRRHLKLCRHIFPDWHCHLWNLKHTCSKQQQHDVHYFHFQLNPSAPQSSSAKRRKFVLPCAAEWRLERIRTGTAKFRRLFSFPLQWNLFLDGPGDQFAFDERARL